MTCGNCLPCLERTNSLLRTPVVRRRALPAPTAEALLRHAERFGPALVNETAAEYGLAVKVKGEDWKARRDRRRRRRRR